MPHITQSTRISSSVACDIMLYRRIPCIQHLRISASILGYHIVLYDTSLPNIIHYLRVAYCILENHDRKLTFELRLFFGCNIRIFKVDLTVNIQFQSIGIIKVLTPIFRLVEIMEVRACSYGKKLSRLARKHFD